jgi:hypothetical protein
MQGVIVPDGYKKLAIVIIIPDYSNFRNYCYTPPLSPDIPQSPGTKSDGDDDRQ